MNPGEGTPLLSAPAGFTLGPEIGGRPGRTRVYAGLDFNGIPVALKTLDPNATDARLAQARFEAECRVHAHVQGCPHVLPLRLPLPTGWLITSWAHGGSLAEWIARHEQTRSAAHAEVLRIVIALLEACRALYEREVVHRDIKPSNILLDGRAIWLSDFGLAAIRHDDGIWRSLPAPWTETEIGTPEWAAPELMRAPPMSHSGNDVYGIGRVWKAMAQVSASEPPEFAELRSRMLGIDPDERPSAQELLTRLESMSSRASG